MRILLTNDDGLRAPGLAALHRALADPDGVHGGPIGEVVVVAPLTVQSATSHGITFHEPLMVRTEEVSDVLTGVAVDGRPADCVKLALSSLYPERYGEGARPDLLISGMNAGANCGVNVIYSGTVAAAIEGAFLGVPSIAVSLHLGGGTPHFDVAAVHARQVIDRILEHGMDDHECLNVNLPITESESLLPDVQVCPMNTHGLVDRYERRVSPGGDVYYWAAGDGLDFHGMDPGTDVHALFERRITVTPLRYDLTQPDALPAWEEHLRS